MRSRFLWSITCLAISCVMSGCASYSSIKERDPVYRPQVGAAGPLLSAQTQVAEAMSRAHREPQLALAGYLSAAEIASRQLEIHPEDPIALSEYNFAVGRIIKTIDEAKLDPWTHPLTVPAEGEDYVLTKRPDPRPQWNPALYNFTPADQFDVSGKYVSKRTIRPGLGAPLVAIGREENVDARKNFMLPRTYYGVTAIARFKGRQCEISFEDPLAAETVQIQGHRYPLAADFTVPLAVMLASTDPKKLELARMLRPEKYAETAQITRLQPFDPNKTVVLVIHGLMDSQATWTPMINELRSDPTIRANYQFWFYSYPSGYPYPHSAAILRQELDQVEKKFAMRKPMVVIGHSMGGCISRLLITDSGDQLWLNAFKKPVDEVQMGAENKRLFTDALIFKHRPEVGRVIFIAAPLKGSDMASHWLGRLGSSLVKSPITLLRAGEELQRNITFLPDELKLKRIPNSVDTLAPNNRFVKAINSIPLTPGIPYNTIIGDRGKGDTPDSSDGVVPYWSSHMEGAESELVVPSDHSAHQNPQAIQEVRRILLQDIH